MASAPQEVLLSTAATRQRDWRLAAAVVLVSIVGLALAVPYADYRWPVNPSFIAAYEAALLVCDLITAVLLIGQFRQVRSIAVLIVGCGYLFDAVIIAVHAVRFPDVFSATGLLGANRQTTPWLYIMWHGTFPIFICAYVLVVRSRWNAPLEEHRAGAAIVIGVVGVVGVAAVCTLLATWGVDLLPEIIRGNDYKRVVTSGIAPGAWLISLVALALLSVRTRGRTVLDLWLMVVMVAWLLDILLSTLFSTVRYDFGWYAGRIYGLMAASFVLGALLLEANLLYGRLARLLVEAKEKNAALETQTAELARSHESAIRDVTARKSAEKALRASEVKFRGILESAPDAMVVVNQGGEIVLLNLQAEKQFGYRRDELVSQEVKNIIPEGFAERLIADGLRSAEDALAQRIGTGIELTGRRKDGGEFPIELMLSPLESAEGILVTAAIRDISARKKAEANLLQKVAELNRSNEELGQFAYMASHDLQEPLRMVASYTQLLSRRYKGKLDSDADEFIAFAVDGASRMQRLIQDLLAYSRVGTEGSNLLDISSEDALQQALINLRSAIEESGALVTHERLPTVLADETQLSQLFQNLVGNAIKYQGSGVPKVHIAAAMNGGSKWTFSVQDNGLGIEPQYFERIFGMFQRLHKREAFAGTGIGLAICKKIVEQHGGSISVESQPGQGSTFRFALARSERES